MHSDIRPVPATRADTLPASAPSVSPGPAAARGGQSVAIRTTTSMKEPCNACGADWQQAHFTQGGRLLCELCWQGQRPATSMPPTRLEQLLLEQWIAPLNRRAQP
jgi:hypothetical protein